MERENTNFPMARKSEEYSAKIKWLAKKLLNKKTNKIFIINYFFRLSISSQDFSYFCVLLIKARAII